MKKENKLKVWLLILLIALGVAGASAYFVDTDVANNTFEIGNVAIDLEEPSWIEPFDIAPNQTFKKDPIVINSGENGAYVYMMVDVPYIKDGQDDSVKELFSYQTNPKWAKVDTIVNENSNSMTHVYAYVQDVNSEKLEILLKGEQTNALFDEITFANITSGHNLEGVTLDVVVTAYAIQSNSVNDNVLDTWSVIQNKTNLTQIRVVVKDDNDKNLRATAKKITGIEKDNLLKSLESSGLANASDVSLLIDVEVEDFSGNANAIFDVSSFANEKNIVNMFHYDMNNKTWEYIGQDMVDKNLTVSGTFSSFSPVAFVTSGDADLIGDAYAIFSETDNSLTFIRSEMKPVVGEIYDGKVISSVYTGFEADEYEQIPDPENERYLINSPWHEENKHEVIESVVFDDVIKPISTANWFYRFSECTSFDLNNLDTTNVTDMTSMFSGCVKLESLDVAIFDTSNVENMIEMFSCCSELKNLDLSNFDTSKVTNMAGLFNLCGELTSVNLSGIDTSNVENMRYMFGYCYNLTGVDVSSFNPIKAIDMCYMFYLAGCDSDTFEIKGLENWDVSNVKDMEGMFKAVGHKKGGAFTLPGIKKWDVSGAETMRYMFYQAGYEATDFELDLSEWDVSNVKDFNYMFEYAGQYVTGEWSVGNLKDWDVSSAESMYYMFAWSGENASSWFVGDLSNWDVSNVTNMAATFHRAGLNADYLLDLSAWKDKVAKSNNHHGSFNRDVEDKVISPWK